MPETIYLMYEGLDIKQGDTADSQVLTCAINFEDMIRIEPLYKDTPHTWFQWDRIGTQLLNGRPYVKEEI